MCKETYKQKSNKTAESDKKIINSMAESDREIINSLESDLKYEERQYYAIVNANLLTPVLTGRRHKFSLNQHPSDYYRRYNIVKGKLEKLTEKKYPLLETETEYKKNFKKSEKEFLKKEE